MFSQRNPILESVCWNLVYFQFICWIYWKSVDYSGHSVCGKAKKVCNIVTYYNFLKIFRSALIFNFFLTRFNLHMHWTTTIFIISLALADLLYCSIHLPLYAMQFFTHRWILGETLCFAFSAFRYINAFADWMSVGMFTSRFRNTTSKKKCTKLFSLHSWF